MSKHFFMIAAFTALSAAAGVNTSQLNISQLSVHKADDAMTVIMTVDPSAYKMKSDRLVVLTPAIASVNDTLRLPSVTVAGRNAWYQEYRNTSDRRYLLRAGKGLPYEYSATVDYLDWMQESRLIMLCDTVNECRCENIGFSAVPVADMDFTPVVYQTGTETFDYIVPSDTIEKIFNLSGRANIIFKVNRTDIDWTYKSNYAELDTILKTIDVVKDNPDASVQSIHLTGYASPEGSYANNVRLAKGRTEAVKRYVAERSAFPASVYSTSSVPEDWRGLREWLVASSVPGKESMIAFIDDRSIPEEVRNDLFRERFPEAYSFLLENVYPLLRHTDYLITYRIRRYFDVEEIAEVMRTNPRNLSLNELFILASSYEKGSPEYDEVFITAARLYPDSETANMNAAFSAMNRGEVKSARLFLSRVAPSVDTVYAEGILSALEGDREKALLLLNQAAEEGHPKALEAIREVEAAASPAERIKLL